ncbi:MAG: hypothetical protein ABIP48_17230 [Planctomycetota bacterium]
MTRIDLLDYLRGPGKLWLGLFVLVVAPVLGVWQAIALYGQGAYLDVVLGCTPVEGILESGFHFQEYSGSEPFRWTHGGAKLLVPINPRRPPQHLWISIETLRPKAGPVRFQVLMDDILVFDESVPLGKWEKTLDLPSEQFSDKVMVELRSDTFVPKGVIDGGKNTDTRVLGVQVKGIMLKRDEK